MTGTYYRTIYRNQETGVAKFQITPTENCQFVNDGLVTCIGKIGIYTRNIPIEVQGSYNTEEEIYYVSSDSLPVKDEHSTISILEYITTDLTEIQKDKLAKLAENDLFSFVEKKDAMKQIMDMFNDEKKAKRVAQSIITHVKKLKAQEEVTKELMSYGFPIDRIEVLYKKELTLKKLDRNPYLLMLKFGIAIDNIEMYTARRLQMSEFSVVRLCGFLYDALVYNTRLGNTCCTLPYLVKIMNMRFKYHGMYQTVVDEALVNFCIESLTDEVAYRIVNDMPFVYLHHIWEEETIAVSHLRRLQSNKKDYTYNNFSVSDVEREIGISYNRGQKNVFQALHTSGVKILTGPPGSGKTAVINGLIKYFKENNNGVVRLAATTGRASKVMSKACNDDAETVNLMLNVRPFESQVQGRDLNNPVEADLIIVDEVSMLGLQLFSILVRAVRSGSILLLVGDEDQLQSVEYGNVLHDLIESGKAEVYRLTEILRQSGTICDNAQLINRGSHALKRDVTFSIKTFQEPQEIIDELQKKFVKDVSQILAPMKNGTLSTFNLNTLFQDQTSMFVAAYGKKVFRVGDKVIMTKTNYDQGYINGDMGYVVGSNADETVIVKFDTGNVTLDRQDLRDMELADAITVHKSQGSEFDDVHIILPLEARHMMTRRILYTGVTRAKKSVTVYAIDNALNLAIDDTAERKRITLLKARIME